MMAERPALGIPKGCSERRDPDERHRHLQKKAPVKAYRATTTVTPVKIPAMGVRTPDLDLTAVREKEPVAG